MLNYGSPNNNPLEYGALITKKNMLNKLDNNAKEIFNNGLQKTEWVQIFKDLENLLNGKDSKLEELLEKYKQ